MSLNIKNEETCRLAADLARLTGETKTGAITVALRELSAILLEHAPHLDPRRPVQPRAATDAGRAPVLGLRRIRARRRHVRMAAFR